MNAGAGGLLEALQGEEEIKEGCILNTSFFLSRPFPLGAWRRERGVIRTPSRLGMNHMHKHVIPLP